MYLQINTVKYDADREIMKIYKNLWLVRSQIFTDMLLFVYIRSTSNIYRFISIQIHCQRIAIQLLLTISNIQSAIWWVIMKAIFNYLCQPMFNNLTQAWLSIFHSFSGALYQGRNTDSQLREGRHRLSTQAQRSSG